MKKQALISAAFGVSVIATLAVAAAPDPNYAGRPLPGFAKDLLWKKVCDIPQADPDQVCEKGSDCPLKRSDGTPYKPQVFAWQDLTMFEWTAGSNAFGPAFIESKIATDSELGGSARTAIELASGLPLAIEQPVKKPVSDDRWMPPPPIKVNPKIVAWVQRELLPAADHPMCGKTAEGVYAAAFRAPTRVAAEVYAALAQKGLLKKVSVDELGKNFNNQRGRYFSACQAIAKKSPDPDGEWPRIGNCWWWLRRAATNTAEPVANLLAEVLRRYDNEAWKKYERAFPKAP